MSGNDDRVLLELRNVRSAEAHEYRGHCNVKEVDRGEQISIDIRSFLTNLYSQEWVDQGLAEFNDNPRSRAFNKYSHIKYVDDNDRGMVTIPNVRAEDRYLFNKHCALNDLDRGEEISVIMWESMAENFQEMTSWLRSDEAHEHIRSLTEEDRQNSANQSNTAGRDTPFDDFIF